MCVVYKYSITIVLLLAVCTASLAATPPVKIGIVVPIALPAMDEIVYGFQQTLRHNYSGEIQFLVKNAQNDPNLQHAILQEFDAEEVTVVAAIGTSASQMAIATLKNIPIVAIAAEIKPSDLIHANNPNVTNVLDEISLERQLAFIHQVLPELKKITLIHSADPRIFNEVKQATRATHKLGMQLQDLLIQEPSDLYTVSLHIAEDAKAIFILKDELVVSGMPTLVQQAKRLHIPIIASDDGSVQTGAAFALGVREKQIGVEAALLTVKLLNGTPAQQIPFKIMDKYIVFFNSTAMIHYGLSQSSLEKAAQSQHYALQKLEMKS